LGVDYITLTVKDISPYMQDIWPYLRFALNCPAAVPVTKLPSNLSWIFSALYGSTKDNKVYTLHLEHFSNVASAYANILKTPITNDFGQYLWDFLSVLFEGTLQKDYAKNKFTFSMKKHSPKKLLNLKYALCHVFKSVAPQRAVNVRNKTIADVNAYLHSVTTTPGTPMIDATSIKYFCENAFEMPDERYMFTYDNFGDFLKLMFTSCKLDYHMFELAMRYPLTTCKLLSASATPSNVFGRPVIVDPNRKFIPTVVTEYTLENHMTAFRNFYKHFYIGVPPTSVVVQRWKGIYATFNITPNSPVKAFNTVVSDIVTECKKYGPNVISKSSNASVIELVNYYNTTLFPALESYMLTPPPNGNFAGAVSLFYSLEITKSSGPAVVTPGLTTLPPLMNIASVLRIAMFILMTISAEKTWIGLGDPVSINVLYGLDYMLNSLLTNANSDTISVVNMVIDFLGSLPVWDVLMGSGNISMKTVVETVPSVSSATAYLESLPIQELFGIDTVTYDPDAGLPQVEGYSQKFLESVAFGIESGNIDIEYYERPMPWNAYQWSPLLKATLVVTNGGKILSQELPTTSPYRGVDGSGKLWKSGAEASPRYYVNTDSQSLGTILTSTAFPISFTQTATTMFNCYIYLTNLYTYGDVGYCINGSNIYRYSTRTNGAQIGYDQSTNTVTLPNIPGSNWVEIYIDGKYVTSGNLRFYKYYSRGLFVIVNKSEKNGTVLNISDALIGVGDGILSEDNVSPVETIVCPMSEQKYLVPISYFENWIYSATIGQMYGAIWRRPGIFVGDEIWNIFVGYWNGESVVNYAGEKLHLQTSTLVLQTGPIGVFIGALSVIDKMTEIITAENYTITYTQDGNCTPQSSDTVFPSSRYLYTEVKNKSNPNPLPRSKRQLVPLCTLTLEPNMPSEQYVVKGCGIWFLASLNNFDVSVYLTTLFKGDYGSLDGDMIFSSSPTRDAGLVRKQALDDGYYLTWAAFVIKFGISTSELTQLYAFDCAEAFVPLLQTGYTLMSPITVLTLAIEWGASKIMNLALKYLPNMTPGTPDFERFVLSVAGGIVLGNRQSDVMKHVPLSPFRETYASNAVVAPGTDLYLSTGTTVSITIPSDGDIPLVNTYNFSYSLGSLTLSNASMTLTNMNTQPPYKRQTNIKKYTYKGNSHVSHFWYNQIINFTTNWPTVRLNFTINDINPQVYTPGFLELFYTGWKSTTNDADYFVQDAPISTKIFLHTTDEFTPDSSTPPSIIYQRLVGINSSLFSTFEMTNGSVTTAPNGDPTFLLPTITSGGTEIISVKNDVNDESTIVIYNIKLHNITDLNPILMPRNPEISGFSGDPGPYGIFTAPSTSTDESRVTLTWADKTGHEIKAAYMNFMAAFMKDAKMAAPAKSIMNGDAKDDDFDLAKMATWQLRGSALPSGILTSCYPYSQLPYTVSVSIPTTSEIATPLPPLGNSAIPPTMPLYSQLAMQTPTGILADAVYVNEHRHGFWMETAEDLSGAEQFWMRLPQAPDMGNYTIDLDRGIDVHPSRWIILGYDIYSVPDEPSWIQRIPISEANPSSLTQGSVVGTIGAGELLGTTTVGSIVLKTLFAPVSAWLENTGVIEQNRVEIDLRHPVVVAPRLGYPEFTSMCDQGSGAVTSANFIDLTPENVYNYRQTGSQSTTNIPKYVRLGSLGYACHIRTVPEISDGRDVRDLTVNNAILSNVNGQLIPNGGMSGAVKKKVYCANRIIGFNRATKMVQLELPIPVAYNEITASKGVLEKYRYTNFIHVSKLISVSSTAERHYGSISGIDMKTYDDAKFEVVDAPIQQNARAGPQINARPGCGIYLYAAVYGASGVLVADTNINTIVPNGGHFVTFTDFSTFRRGVLYKKSGDTFSPISVIDHLINIGAISVSHSLLELNTLTTDLYEDSPSNGANKYYTIGYEHGTYVKRYIPTTISYATSSNPSPKLYHCYAGYPSQNSIFFVTGKIASVPSTVPATIVDWNPTTLSIDDFDTNVGYKASLTTGGYTKDTVYTITITTISVSDITVYASNIVLGFYNPGDVFGVTQMRPKRMYTDLRTAVACTRTTRMPIVMGGSIGIPSLHWTSVNGHPYYSFETLRNMCPYTSHPRASTSMVRDLISDNLPWDQRVMNSVRQCEYVKFRALVNGSENMFKSRFVTKQTQFATPPDPKTNPVNYDNTDITNITNTMLGKDSVNQLKTIQNNIVKYNAAISNIDPSPDPNPNPVPAITALTTYATSQVPGALIGMSSALNDIIGYIRENGGDTSVWRAITLTKLQSKLSTFTSSIPTGPGAWITLHDSEVPTSRTLELATNGCKITSNAFAETTSACDDFQAELQNFHNSILDAWRGTISGLPDFMKTEIETVYLNGNKGIYTLLADVQISVPDLSAMAQDVSTSLTTVIDSVITYNNMSYTTQDPSVTWIYTMLDAMRNLADKQCDPSFDVDILNGMKISLLQIFMMYCEITGVIVTDIALFLSMAANIAFPTSAAKSLISVSAPPGYEICKFDDDLSTSILATMEFIAIGIAIDTFDDLESLGYTVTSSTPPNLSYEIKCGGGGSFNYTNKMFSSTNAYFVENNDSYAVSNHIYDHSTYMANLLTRCGPLRYAVGGIPTNDGYINRPSTQAPWDFLDSGAGTLIYNGSAPCGYEADSKYFVYVTYTTAVSTANSDLLNLDSFNKTNNNVISNINDLTYQITITASSTSCKTKSIPNGFVFNDGMTINTNVTSSGASYINPLSIIDPKELFIFRPNEINNGLYGFILPGTGIGFYLQSDCSGEFMKVKTLNTGIVAIWSPLNLAPYASMCPSMGAITGPFCSNSQISTAVDCYSRDRNRVPKPSTRSMLPLS
jgi:hypothetical protein